MIPMVLSVDSLMGMETLTSVSSLAGFLVELVGIAAVFLAEGSGLSVAGDSGILDILAGSLTCLVVRY